METVGSSINEPNDSNFDFLGKINLNKSQLNIKVELGVFSIPPRKNFAASYVENYSENQFFPSPGGKQSQSFAANPILAPNKSQTLTSTVNGIANQHFEVTGAPYCTFVEGTLEANKVHPYYNLIIGPPNAPTYASTTTLTFADNPQNFNQDFKPVNNAESLVFNKVGTPFIPGTTKTSKAVAEKQDSGEIAPIISYNIWKVENLMPDPGFQQWLGFLPKPGATVDNTQPYAQTLSYSDTAEIQVYASNSQVSLLRCYPMAKDYAHDRDCKYLFYDSASDGEVLRAIPAKLYKTEYTPDPLKPKEKKRVPAVGFVLKFSSVTLSNIQPTQVPNQDGVLSSPQILISWGKIDATPEELNLATKNKEICKYTLKLSADSTPTIYFNISDNDVKNTTISANARSVVLTSLQGLNIQGRNSGAKSPNDFSIFVYYSGPYLQIGNSTNPGEWQTVAAPKNVKVNNYVSGPGQPEEKLKHMLDEKSQIRISAQFVNFRFSYGPPIFSPHDSNNIKNFTNTLANTLNFVSGALPVGLSKDEKEKLPTEVPSIIFKNAIGNFGSAEDYDTNVKPDDIEIKITELNSPAFYDVRTDWSEKDLICETTAKDSSFKLTFPENAGGFTFNNFKPVSAPDPEIKESYTRYDLRIEKSTDSISAILSNAVKSLTITKKVDDADAARIESTLNITFINLNKSLSGFKILQFMRQNITTLRISAGYETLYPFFEGMVEDIVVTEGLSETTIVVNSKDLLQKLFVDSETMILPTVFMKFPGMRYNKAINQMVYYSELNNHFKYALGDPLDQKGQSLAYALNFNKYYRLPRIDVATLNIAAASLMIKAYDDKTYTYYNMLKTIKNLSIQVSDKISVGETTRFDVPIYYWYTSGSSEDMVFQDSTDVVNGNGIVMSSRTMAKDEDTFYLYKRAISPEMTTDISSLHGTLFSESAFTSKSKSTNLFRSGLYRYFDTQNTPHVISVSNDKETKTAKNLPVIDKIESYVGYEKIILFDNPPSNFGEIKMPNTLIPVNEYAQSWVNRIFNASFVDVYENITLKSLVTKPLKEWGSFFVTYESTELDNNGQLVNVIVKMPDRYLYSSVTYTFDIDKNLITAEIDASKKAIQALD